MVTAATSFSRNGLADWLVQRFSAVILAAYTFFIVIYLLCHPDLSYAQWSALFSHFPMRVFSLAVLLSVVAHGWIGLWGVLTDYMTSRMIGAIALPLRIVVLFVYAVVCLVFLVWGVNVLWGF